MLRKIVTQAERYLSPILSRLMYPPSGAKAVCVEGDKVVLLNTGSGYRFPGGMVEAGEHPKETARREFKEETGLNTAIQDLLTIKTMFNGIEATHFFYEASTDEELSQNKKTWEGEPELVKLSNLSGEMREIAEKPVEENKHD